MKKAYRLMQPRATPDNLYKLDLSTLDHFFQRADDLADVLTVLLGKLCSLNLFQDTKQKCNDTVELMGRIFFSSYIGYFRKSYFRKQQTRNISKSFPIIFTQDLCQLESYIFHSYPSLFHSA